MSAASVTVLGAGNTGFAAAAKLALEGVQVTLAELPAFAAALDPIRESREIRLDGVAGTGLARIAGVTDDVGAAIAASEILLLIVPAYAHAPWARALAPHLRAGQTLTLFPGTLGSLEVAEVLRDAGAPTITLAETDTAPYVCRKTSPDGATIWGVVPHMGLGVYPASETEAVRARLDPLFPGLRPVAHVLECGLNAMNPVVHPAGVLLNAGRIERSHGDFYFYEEGVTPGVVDVIERVDAERRALGATFGLTLPPVAEAFAGAGFGPPGDLWSTINGSRMLTALRAPGALDTRWLSEDVPYGLGIWSMLARQVGIPTPTIDAVIQLGLIVLHEPPDAIKRTPAALGVEGLSHDEILDRVRG